MRYKGTARTDRAYVCSQWPMCRYSPVHHRDPNADPLCPELRALQLQRRSPLTRAETVVTQATQIPAPTSADSYPSGDLPLPDWGILGAHHRCGLDPHAVRGRSAPILSHPHIEESQPGADLCTLVVRPQEPQQGSPYSGPPRATPHPPAQGGRPLGRPTPRLPAPPPGLRRPQPGSPRCLPRRRCPCGLA